MYKPITIKKLFIILFLLTSFKASCQNRIWNNWRVHSGADYFEIDNFRYDSKPLNNNYPISYIGISHRKGFISMPLNINKRKRKGHHYSLNKTLYISLPRYTKFNDTVDLKLTSFFISLNYEQDIINKDRHILWLGIGPFGSRYKITNTYSNIAYANNGFGINTYLEYLLVINKFLKIGIRGSIFLDVTRPCWERKDVYSNIYEPIKHHGAKLEIVLGIN